MDTKATFKVNFLNGTAEIPFPYAMKHSDCTISCISIYVPGVRKAKSECLFITCESSYFRKLNFDKHHNVLATFTQKTVNKMYNLKDLWNDYISYFVISILCMFLFCISFV